MNVLTINHFHISHKELFQIMVLKRLEQQDDMILSLYEDLKEKLPGKKMSRSHFYATIKEMETIGFIEQSPVQDRRKKIFHITPQGTNKLLEYNGLYFEPYMALKQIVELFIHDLSGANPLKRPTVFPLQPQQKKFFSKLINVREVIEWVMLKELIKNEKIPADLLTYFQMNYGWQPGEGYLYEVVRSMEEHGWIIGEWESDRRSKRIYQIDERGRQVLPRIEESVLYTMKNIRSFINNLLGVFHL